MEKMNGYSLNIVKENIEKLKEIFPEVFCEDKVDFERLQEILGEYIEDREERYRFEWNGKSKAIRIAQTPTRGTLRPCKEESKNWDTTENLYIEGDNLEVLKLLQKSYQNKIKMIYIDPPYNTGNDFVYKDDYKDNLQNYLEITGQIDEEGNKTSTNSQRSGRFHTDWLNMMYPRLRLARTLLKDDGIIFISIDDNEAVNLKKICDEIFGDENFIINLIWKKRGAAPNDKAVGYIHENILMYSKNINLAGINRSPRSEEQLKRYQNPDNHPKGLWAADNLMANVKGGRYVQSLYYPIINPNTGEKHYPSSNGNWRFNKEKIQKLLDNNEIYFGADGNGRPKLKRFLCDVQDGVPYSSIWDDCGYNNTGSKVIQQLLDNLNIFDTAKPVELLEKLIQMGGDDTIILDFFSGAATTAHAVIKQNLLDNKKRKFIMVQLPEPIEEKSEAFKAGYKNICEIGKERIRRAGDKIVEENKDKEGIDDLDIGFKVFKLDTSNIKPWNPSFENIANRLDEMVDNFVPDRTEEDVVYEIMLKYGIDLTYPIEVRKINGKKVFSIGVGTLIICLDNEITLDVVKGIVDLKNELNPEMTRVVFKDNGFKTDSVKTNAIEILKRNNINEVMSI